MGPVQSIGSGAAGAASPIANRPVTRTGLGDGASGVGGAGSASTAAITQAFNAVSDMLHKLGGGLEKDQNLRMIIGLLILLALLGRSQQDTQSEVGDALMNDLGSSNPGGAQASSSGSFLAIEQTTTTIVFGSSESYSNSGPEPSGGRLDLSA